MPKPGAGVALEHENFERGEGCAKDDAENGAQRERAMRVVAVGSAEEGADQGARQDNPKICFRRRAQGAGSKGRSAPVSIPREKPGALECEPLEAVGGVADAARSAWSHLKVA